MTAILQWLFSKLDPPRPAPPHRKSLLDLARLAESLSMLPMADLRWVLRSSQCQERIGRALIESNSRVENLALLRGAAVYLNLGCVVHTGLTAEESDMIRRWNDADAEKIARLRWEL